jgi:hypothetical protein
VISFRDSSFSFERILVLGPDTTVFPFGRRLAAAKLRSLMHLYYDTRPERSIPAHFGLILDIQSGVISLFPAGISISTPVVLPSGEYLSHF